MTQLTLVKEKGNLHLNGITAEHIEELLRKRHEKDVLVSECKNGETWGARDLLKLDAWVLRRTYSPLTTIGYEIKVSRQDFENDQKWTGYLDLCHQFYFVCPAGLIRATDLPQRIGIIWASKDHLHTKRKAEWVNPDIEKLNRLLIYVVMARSKIVANMNMVNINETDNSDNNESRLKIQQEWVAEQTDKKLLASIVKGNIKRIYEECTNKEQNFKRREDNLKRFEEHLAKLGIVWDSNSNDWQDTQRVENEIDLLKKVMDRWTLIQIKNTGKAMIEVAERIEKFHTTE